MFNAITHNLNVLGSVTTSSLTAWRGCLVVRPVPQPEKPLVLYDIEACPYCRRVREALTALHLDVEIRPCPRGGREFRSETYGKRDGFFQVYSKVQVPYLEDPNTGERLFESSRILEYLNSQYGN